MPDAAIPIEDITAAVAVLHAGDRAGGRERLMALWARGPSPTTRCILAHYIADAQDSVAEELAWDRAALAAADAVTVAEETDIMPGVTVAAFYPSLWLNLSDAALRAGDLAEARRAHESGAATLALLPNDPYGVTVRNAFSRLAERLDAAG